MNELNKKYLITLDKNKIDRIKNEYEVPLSKVIRYILNEVEKKIITQTNTN